jgi:pimeloyl-ACP methyl ester carboxylesterase
MLSVRWYGSGSKDAKGPLVVMLHWLGGSAGTWAEVGEGLAARGLRPVGIDLPGFGRAVDEPGYSVHQMATAVRATIRGLRADELDAPWLLMGHSMGGKVAAVLARAATLPNVKGLQGLAGLVLVSPSPPGPEPMKDAKRSHLLDSLGLSTGNAEEDRDRAIGFLNDNTGKLALEAAVRERAAEDILRMNRAAFTHWLEHGSKEDWSERVGVLPQPALVFAGTEDGSLGPEAQREHTLPHFASAELVTLQAAGHLGPLERPALLVERIVAFAETLELPLIAPERELSVGFRALMESARTSPQTRAVMTARMAPVVATASAFTAEQLGTLRVLVECVLPQPGFDLVARLVRLLEQGAGDGWRFADLPADSEAWRTGLASLDAAAEREHGVEFLALSAAMQRELLLAAQHGELGARGLLGSLGIGSARTLFNAQQMQRWFEDARATLARLYTADPRTMDRIGFHGFADDAGFTRIQLHQQLADAEREEVLA